VHAGQLAHVVGERFLRPPNRAGAKRDEDLAVGVAGEVRQPQADVAVLVSGPTVLVLGWRVPPAVGLKELRDPLEVLEPDRRSTSSWTRVIDPA
jgi:hypothetical protein